MMWRSQDDVPVLAMGVFPTNAGPPKAVGSGSILADTVTAYDAARFGFSYENEGREYVSFDAPPDAYGFRAQSATGDALADDALRAPGPQAGLYRCRRR